MAKATYDFPTDISFRDAARTILEQQFRQMMENHAGTLRGTLQSVAGPAEVEALHDMRVASRRLRAALAVFAKIFSKSEFRVLSKEIASVTDALGAVRDLDVQLAELQKVRDSLPENEAYGIERLIARRTKMRNHERKLLKKTLKKMDVDTLTRRFIAALDRTTGGAKKESKKDG